jgi:hypothetical protein
MEIVINRENGPWLMFISEILIRFHVFGFPPKKLEKLENKKPYLGPVKYKKGFSSLCGFS